MWLSWFDATETKKFGNSLAQFFMERLPLDPNSRKNKSMDRQREVLDKMFVQIAQFGQQHKPNLYKKAQLGNAFKWTLNDAGYDPEFVDQLTKSLLTKL